MQRIVFKVIGSRVVRPGFFYGWVVAGTGVVLMATNSTILNSFGVFFKPLAADFGWSRATTSGVQSAILICFGLFAVLAGWLADRFGPARVLAVCGLFAGLGLILTSQASEWWHVYLTYSLLTGIGISSTFAITGVTTARWFVKRRGLGLGIVASGVGLGALVGVPGMAALIAMLGWSRAYLVLGAAALVIMTTGALLLSRSPGETVSRHDTETPAGGKTDARENKKDSALSSGVTLLTAVRSRNLWLMLGVFFLFSFSYQMMMVHLVNYATDMGITPLVAATLVSGVGLSGVAGRILMGGASDRVGSVNILVIACLGVAVSLVWLIFAGALWMLYLFAIVYGFFYGAEVPQQTALTGRLFGLRVMLVGITVWGAQMGGALGSWVGGIVFDLTHSYQGAFAIGVVAVICALAGALMLRRSSPTVSGHRT